MAKTKEPSVDDALTILKSVLQRSLLTDYLHVNQVMLSKNNKDASVIVIPEQELWLKLMEDPEMKDHITELDIKDEEQSKLLPVFSYANDFNGMGWLDLPAEEIYKGKVIEISIEGFSYDIPVNRALLPLKLRKAEADNISYKVVRNPKEVILLIKKKFMYPKEGCSFTLMRMYQIV